MFVRPRKFRAYKETWSYSETLIVKIITRCKRKVSFIQKKLFHKLPAAKAFGLEESGSVFKAKQSLNKLEIGEGQRTTLGTTFNDSTDLRFLPDSLACI